MLHNTGPFGPNDGQVNVNPQSNMTSMSGRMNIGNNINNLPKLPQQSAQAVNAHFNLPDYPPYGLNMNPSLSPFQNFHHVGFQQNSMSQSAIHENWQNNMLPMNLNMQGDHPMLGFAQYGKPDLSEQSYNKSMLNVPQVHTKAFHKQMGMDINYQYNLNPSYRPYMDYNLGLSSKQKTDDLRQLIDLNMEKERLASSPHYMEQIDLSNKQKMHSFPRSYLETTTTKSLQDSGSVNMTNNLTLQSSKRRDKPTYLDTSDSLKSQLSVESRYIDSQLDLSKSQKTEIPNTAFQNINADLRYYKDSDITRPHNLEISLSKSHKSDILSSNYSNAISGLRMYKEQDPRALSYEKMLSKSHPSENLSTNYQSISSDYRYYKEKQIRPESLETLSKNQNTGNPNINYPNDSNFQDVNLDLRFYKDKNFRSESSEIILSKSQKSENVITNFENNTNFQNVSTEPRYYKDKNVRSESLVLSTPKPQKSENLNPNFTTDTNFQNVNSDLTYYKDNNLSSEKLESGLIKTQKTEIPKVNFANDCSDLSIYKDQDTRNQGLEKDRSNLQQQPETLQIDYQNPNSENKNRGEPRCLEESSTKEETPKDVDTNLSNANSDLQFTTQVTNDKSSAQSNDSSAPKLKQSDNLITNYHNYSSDLRFYKDQDSRRRSLENTVKMIENILSHSSNSRKSNFNINQEKSSLQDQSYKEKGKPNLKGIDENIKDECTDTKTNANTAGSTNIDNTSNSFNKTDESDANTSNEMDVDNANSNDEMDVDNQTSDDSDIDDENKDSIDENLQEISNTTNKVMKKVEEEEEESKSEISTDEDVKPKISIETDHPEVKIDDSIVVKVEVVPSLVDMEHFNPFHRDTSGVQSEDTSNHDIIDSETSITVAKEVIRNGASVQGAYFECPHCNLYFDQPKRFIIHTKWHSFGLTNEKRMELQKEKEMRKHMRKEARMAERMLLTEVTDANAPGRKFNCRDCDKVFNAKASLKNHRQRYHPTRSRNCKICGKIVLGWMALRSHMATHTCESGYQCDDCPKRFKHPHSLAKHRDTHLEKTQACPQCPKKFGSVTLLNVHMKTHERALRGATFRCTYCGKGFFESYSLQVHERTHRNERPYLCQICNTSFGTNSSLKRHLKVSHSSTKPWECSTCHRSFISEAIRDRHTMRNHGNPEDFKFMCKQCPCKYLKLKDLRKHMYKVHPKGKRKKKAHSDSE